MSYVSVWLVYNELWVTTDGWMATVYGGYGI